MNPLTYIAVLFLSGLGLFGIIGSGLHEVAQQADRVPVLEQQIQVMESTLGAVNAVAGVPYYLHGSGVGATDTTITLTSFKTPVSSYPLSMTDFGDIGYLTLEPGNTARQEFISFTGISQNADNTAVLTGVTRGLSPVSPFTASTTIRKAHAGGSVAIISNPPQFYERFANKLNTQTITGTWTFASTTWPIIDLSTAAPTLDAQFATKKYVDDTAFSGASVVNASATARGVVELATGCEAASSTASGGSGILAIPSTLATSTYNTATAPCRIVSTGNTGKIDSFFISTSTLFLNQPFSVGTTTMTGSLTLSGGNSASNIASTSIVTFTSSTTPTTTWTKRANLRYVIVEVIGPGGGGGGVLNSGNYGAAGGGGGGYCKKIIQASLLGATETVTVGGGGGGGPGNQNNGSQGQAASSFGSHCTGGAGSGGAGASGGSGGGGGGGTGGDINITGGSGAGTGILSGIGGDSQYGHGGGYRTTDNGGVSGVGFGGGGSGSFCDGSCSASGGGDGSGGAVFVTEVYF